MTRPSRTRDGDAILVVDNISKAFGGVQAVDSLSMDLKKGEIVGLIGPNGAGKTTVLNMISKVTPLDSGDILLDGESLKRMPPHEVSSLGISRTFQEIHLFRGLSVLSNTKAACHLTATYSLGDALVWSSRTRRAEAEIEDICVEMLDMFGLKQHMNKEAQSLPYGRQKLLEIVKALVTRPKVPIITLALSCWTSFLYAETPSAGCPLKSYVTSLTCFPRRPPAALISSTANTHPFRSCVPCCVVGPVSAAISPITMTSRAAFAPNWVTSATSIARARMAIPLRFIVFDTSRL
jgi:ABC-type branched-subunit amino acid transport system ATPase component